MASKERNRFRSIQWEEYDPVHQKYLEIGNKLCLFIITPIYMLYETRPSKKIMESLYI